MISSSHAGPKSVAYELSKVCHAHVFWTILSQNSTIFHLLHFHRGLAVLSGLCLSEKKIKTQPY